MRYFVAVAEELHFGRAAERLHIVQPALSQQINKLEEELDVKLLQRTKRRVELTEAGKAFLEGARDTVVRAESAAETAKRAARGQIGRLVIGFVGPATYNVLPNILSAYCSRYPSVELSLHELTTIEQVKRLRDGKIDVGFVRPPVTDEAISEEVLRREPMVVILPEGHSLTDRQSIPLEALARDSFVMVPRSREPSLHDLYITACHQAGFSPRVSHEANRIHTIVALVASGLGVALSSASVMRFSRPGAVYRELEGTRAQVEMAVAWRAEERSAVVENFLELAREMESLPQTP